MLPYLVQGNTLAQTIRTSSQAPLRIICLGKRENYLIGHLPGAVWLDSTRLNRGILPSPGLLPSPEYLESVLAEIGLGANEHVVSYDDTGGTAGARLMWVLEAMGHGHLSMLDGGLKAWMADGLPLTTATTAVSAAGVPWKAHPTPSVIADKDYVLSRLGDSSVHILDARSHDEFMGRKTRSARKGRIPGARNLNWLDTVDIENDNRLKPPEVLETMLEERGFDREHEIIVHCQTHQRSSHSFVMLRSLGFHRIRAYAGSWMEWAADPSLPIIREDMSDS